VHPEDRGHIEFLSGADLVIHDAQFTDEEYPKKIGWGHSTVEYAVSVALAAGAKRLALFHHDPLRDDEALDRLVVACRRQIEACGGALDLFAAAEGQMLELLEQEAPSPGIVGLTPSSVLPEAVAAGGPPKTVLIVDDEPDLVDFITVALSPEGYRLLSAYDGDAALRIARAEHPSLILLDWQLPGRNGLEVCQTLRAETDPLLRDVPIVLITAQTGAENTAAAFAAGVTDYLTKPFKATYVRSRVRGWLLRTHIDTPDQA
jgi:CheY-like chemotaxis protein